MILDLDDDYAVATSSDRRLYQMTPQTAADQIERLLRVVRAGQDQPGTEVQRPPQVQLRKKKQVNWASRCDRNYCSYLAPRGAPLLAPNPRRRGFPRSSYPVPILLLYSQIS